MWTPFEAVDFAADGASGRCCFARGSPRRLPESANLERPEWLRRWPVSISEAGLTTDHEYVRGSAAACLYQ
jgi:hypothetical protein